MYYNDSATVSLLILITSLSAARSKMVGQVFLVLAGACQFGHGVGGFATNSINSVLLVNFLRLVCT